MAFMQTTSMAYVKAKKAGKSKKCKKHDYDSSDSSNNEQESGYENTCFSADKHLKIDKPLCSVYLSTEACPIKVVNTAPSNNMRADKIANKTAGDCGGYGDEHFCKKSTTPGALIQETGSLLAKRQKVLIFWEKTPSNQENLLRKQEKVRYQGNQRLN